MSDKIPSLEDILEGPLNLILKEEAAGLQRLETIKKELKDFVEKIKSDNPRPDTSNEGRITRSITEKRKTTRDSQPGPSQSDDLDDFFDKSLNESLAKLDMWVEDKKRINQRIIRKGLDAISEAVEDALNITTNQPNVTRTAVIVPDADLAIFQATNRNPAVGAEKKLGARPKESKPIEKQKNKATFSMLDETSFEKFQPSDYPSWSTKRIDTYTNVQLFIDPAVVLNFFPICPGNCDLKEVFPDSNISPADLKRRSSADWSDLHEYKE